jgi:hypothetical protein
MIQLGPIGSTSGKHPKVSIRRVSGAQASGARERLGLIKITKPSARALWDKGISLVLVGNQVNDYHFFSNFCLAMRVDTRACKANQTFDSIVNQFAFYMDRELGRAVAFFVFADELAKSLRDDKSSMKKKGVI